ncbi:hypothetical protein ZWY2020_010380 [Hordeum vulgare]|nr:hypothetical protein ZWY2020_010380 [Hordeum vulgare]
MRKAITLALVHGADATQSPSPASPPPPPAIGFHSRWAALHLLAVGASPRRSPTKVRLRRQRLGAPAGAPPDARRTGRRRSRRASLSDAAADSEASEYGDNEGGDDDVDSAASMASDSDRATDQMLDLLKSRFESPEFLQEFHEIQKSVCQNGAGGDVWEDDGDNGYVLVKPEDAAEGYIYNNQAILKVAGTAIQMSWRVVSKFL